jgi:AraC family transcriptional regulator of adaptative response/methylated-DNA-[protein]-cysteine methyltransferase
VPGRNDVLESLDEQLGEYFGGARPSFDLPLAMAGSDFQQLVWNGLLEIPWGETRSYARKAAAIGRPDAVRAVARANGQNAIAILVPCHRVVGADGSLTGYGGGLWRKQQLLDLERAQLQLVRTHPGAATRGRPPAATGLAPTPRLHPG